MLELFAANWRLHVLRGVLAILFGLAALAWPGLTLGVLVILFGVYALLEGAVAITAAVQRRGYGGWRLLLIEGVAGVAIGLCAFVWPAVTAVVLLVFIAVWALLTGALEIAAAALLRDGGRWLLGVSGVLSVLLGLLLVVHPGAGALAVVWVIGLYAVLFGALMTGLGFTLRKYAAA